MKIVRVDLENSLAGQHLVLVTEPAMTKEILETFEGLVKSQPRYRTDCFSARIYKGLLVVTGLDPAITGEWLNQKLSDAEMLLEREAREKAEIEAKKKAERLAEVTKSAQQLGLPIS